ncbi:hypothetical protein B0H10DRAFT_1997537 [Mycena sp. CBHHK59/15]|nr:hypothetical protein B0H10DRAFT_1997537 [Mycena sp. CBHHK59/15]
MRTPMQVDSEGPGSADETRRWAERVADTKSASPLSLPRFPSLSTPSSSSSSSSFLPSSDDASAGVDPLQYENQPGTHRGRYNTGPATGFALSLAHTHRSLPAPAYAPHPDVGAKSETLPANAKGAVPLAVRRGYADHRLRTFSAPSAADTRQAPPPVTASPSPWLLPPTRKVSQSPLPDPPLARSLSPFADSAASSQRQSFLSTASSMDSEDSTGGSSAHAPTRVDYKEPRALHVRDGAGSPTRLSALEDPIWEVVQDMREQRMSLCQSLRQYVFVHAAIIEGALMVVDEERVRGGHTWRPAVPPPPRRPAASARTRPLGLTLLPSWDDGASGTLSTGKRLASPTELLKEDKKGEIVLSKRPSIKRKQPSMDDCAPPPLPTYPPP